MIVNVLEILGEEKIEDLIVTAIEQGITYWGYVKKTEVIETFERSNAKSKNPIVTSIELLSVAEMVAHVCKSKFPKIAVYDVETEEHIGFISRANINRGLSSLMKGEVKGLDKKSGQKVFSMILLGDFDAEQADIFMQAAVLEEYTFC